MSWVVQYFEYKDGRRKFMDTSRRITVKREFDTKEEAMIYREELSKEKITSDLFELTRIV